MTKLQVLEKVIQALSKQPTLVLGIVVCTSATGLIASASYHNLPPLNPSKTFQGGNTRRNQSL
jgi:hypothetical protein